MIAGSFITPDDQNGILIGQTLAQRLGVKVGNQIDLSANTANGNVNEQTFTVRGIFSTNTPAYDQSTIMMPLAKAQAFTGTQNHANGYMVLIYLIVLAITATVIVNTLIMAVYERTREIGIMAAIGMKGRRIMSLFLAEASMLAIAGIAFGVV